MYSTAQDKVRSVGYYAHDSQRSDIPASGADGHAAEPPVATPWPGVPGEKVTPSPSCLDAAKAAAAEPDPDRADPLIIATLDACTSVTEWMSALEAYPAVMGTAPDKISLQSACWAGPGSDVCMDAQQQGLLD